MEDKWLTASSLDEILPHRSEMLACSLGMDVAHQDIIDEAPELADDEDMEAKWFDITADNLRKVFAQGHGTLYRAIAVDDIDEFLAKAKSGGDVGCCWTWDKECATTSLHGGDWKEHDLLMTATVKPDAVQWSTTFQQNFAHPCEREVRVEGKMLITSIIDMGTGQDLNWNPVMAAA